MNRLILIVLAAAACSRNNASSPQDASASDAPLQSTAPSDAAASSSSSQIDAGFELTTVNAIEAHRSHVARLADDPTLKSLSVVDAHFKSDGGTGTGTSPKGFDIQKAELTAKNRSAILVMESGKANSTEAHPFLVITDNDKSLWTRRPIGGIMPPVGPVAIAAAPNGRVSLAACDPPTKLVALRIFDDDGSPFADFQALKFEECDAVSLLYWPKRGWIITVASAGATRARLVNEEGSLLWAQGLDLGVRSRNGFVAPASLVSDTDDSFVLVQITQPSTVEGSPFHALAFRYDTQGTTIWSAAIDLGELSRAPLANEKATLSQTKPGVRVTLPMPRKTGETEIDITPSGALKPRQGSRAPQ